MHKMTNMFRKKHRVSEDGLRTLRGQLTEARKKRIELAQEIQDVSSQSTFRSTVEDLTFSLNHNLLEDLENRISELEYIISTATIIKKSTAKQHVDVGSKIVLEVDGKKQQYEIVCPLEADPFTGKISDESPFGLSLIGKKLHECISIMKPNKQRSDVTILDIQ